MDQEKKIYNSPMRKWLDDNIGSEGNEGNSVVAYRFIEYFKSKMYKKRWILLVNFILVT